MEDAPVLSVAASVDRQARLSALAPWLHMAAVTLLAVGVQLAFAFGIARREAAGALDALLAVAPAIPGFVYGVLPVAVATSVIFARPRQLLRMALAVSALMLLIDLSAPTTYVKTGERYTVTHATARGTPVFSALTFESASRTAIAFAVGDLTDVGERREVYERDDPRPRAAAAIFKGALLFLPLILTLTVASTLTWMDRWIAFLDPQAERPARVIVSWTLAVGLYWLIYAWSHQARVSAVVGYGALTLILAPYVLALAVTFVLWTRILRDPDEMGA